MANSVRQDILTKFATCLAYITTTNGYSFSVSSSNIFKGFKTMSQVNEYPVIFYELGGETLESFDESYEMLVNKLEAYIGVYFQSTTGNLTDDYEKWIRDLKRFIYKNKTVITANKTLLLDAVDGVQFWSLKEVQPYMDYDKNIGAIYLTLEIDYNEDVKEGL